MIKCIYTHDKKPCDIKNCKYEKCECREFYQQGRIDTIKENLFKDCEMCSLKLTQEARVDGIEQCINIIKQNKNLFITDKLCDELIQEIEQLKENK